MKYQLVVRNRATQDLRQQADYILVNGSAEAAIAFLDAAEATFGQLVKTPSIGKVIQLVSANLGEIRQWRVKNFRDYLIFYRIQTTTVEILRVLHGARDLAEVLRELDREQ